MNRILSALVVCACASSCDMGSSSRRCLLNYVDANWTPTTTASRWLATPVALPVALGAGAVDAVILHPTSQFDDAWWDTQRAIWDFEGSSDFRKVLLMPLSAVATPVVFGVTWSFRAVFDIDDSDPDMCSDQDNVPQVEASGSSEVGQ